MENGTVRIFGGQVMAVGLAMLLAACSAPPKPLPITGSIQVSPQVNPSASKRPSPLLVRVYELKSVATFNAADFMSLYQRDQAELAADLVAKEEYVLAPGEAKTFTKLLAPDTRFLGVIAAFRDLEHSRWRSVMPIQPGQQVVIRVGELSIEAAAAR
jgi:type VI secretion system protein VasD